MVYLRGSWTLSVIGMEIGGVRILGHYVGGPLGVVADAFEGQDGIIGIAHQVVSGIEQGISHIFGTEFVPGQEVISGWVWNSLLNMPADQQYVREYLNAYEASEKDRKDDVKQWMKEHKNSFPSFVEFAGIEDASRFPYVREINDILGSKMPLRQEMRDRLEQLKARPSQKKLEEWNSKIKAEVLSEMLDASKIKAGGVGQIEKVRDVAELIARATKENASVVVAGVSLSSVGTGFIERTKEGFVFYPVGQAPRVLGFAQIPQIVRDDLEKKLPVSVEPRVIYLTLRQEGNLVDEAGKLWRGVIDHMTKIGVDVVKAKKILLPSGMDLKDWMNNLINYNRVRESVSNKKEELIKKGISAGLIDNVLRKGEVAWANVSDSDKKAIKDLSGNQSDLEKVTPDALNEILDKFAVSQATQEHMANAVEILNSLQKNRPSDIKDVMNNPAKKEALEKALGIIGVTGRDWDKASLKELMELLKAKDFNDFMAKIINRLSMMNELDGQINKAQERLNKASNENDRQKIRDEISRLNAKKEFLLIDQSLVTEVMNKKSEGFFQRVIRWFAELFNSSEKNRRLAREAAQEALKPMRISLKMLEILNSKGLKITDLDYLGLDKSTRSMVKRYLEDARYPGVGVKDKNAYITYDIKKDIKEVIKDLQAIIKYNELEVLKLDSENKDADLNSLEQQEAVINRYLEVLQQDMTKNLDTILSLEAVKLGLRESIIQKNIDGLLKRIKELDKVGFISQEIQDKLKKQKEEFDTQLKMVRAYKNNGLYRATVLLEKEIYALETEQKNISDQMKEVNSNLENLRQRYMELSEKIKVIQDIKIKLGLPENAGFANNEMAFMDIIARSQTANAGTLLDIIANQQIDGARLNLIKAIINNLGVGRDNDKDIQSLRYSVETVILEKKIADLEKEKTAPNKKDDADRDLKIERNNLEIAILKLHLEELKGVNTEALKKDIAEKEQKLKELDLKLSTHNNMAQKRKYRDRRQVRRATHIRDGSGRHQHFRLRKVDA